MLTGEACDEKPAQAEFFPGNISHTDARRASDGCPNHSLKLQGTPGFGDVPWAVAGREARRDISGAIPRHFYEVLRPFLGCPMLVCLQLLHVEAMATS